MRNVYKYEGDPGYKGLHKFYFSVTPTVSELDVKWDLYWHMGDDDPVHKTVLDSINDSLSSVAKIAIEQGDRDLFYKSASAFSAYGAGDSETTRQFEWLWEQVYGEDS